MKTLKIDDKWSVEYDPENNDRPVAITRHGEAMAWAPSTWTNDTHAMFYALLEARRMQEAVALVLPEMTPEQMEELRMLGQRTGGLVEVDIIPGKRKALDGAGDVAEQLEGYRSDDFFGMSTQQTDAVIANWVKWGIGNNRYIAAFLNAFAEEIHGRNVRAGWWTDIDTGDNILHTRNVGEMLMLTVTELSEAMEADRKKLMDDKLPHRPGLTVELADAVIRILDLAGSRMAIERNAREQYDASWMSREAYEAQYGAEPGYQREAEPEVHPFGTVLVEKMEFNANREDHKIENRRGPNGKRI